jgi:ATP-dependent Lon protease
MAKVELAEDIYPPTGSEGRLELKKSLLQAFADVIPVSKTIQQNLHELMAGQMSLGPITDIIAYTLPFGVEQKLKLLADPDVDSRARQLVELLASGSVQLDSLDAELDDLSSSSENEPGFPPPFSLN